jgi:hypothetical protein
MAAWATIVGAPTGTATTMEALPTEATIAKDQEATRVVDAVAGCLTMTLTSKLTCSP